MYANLLADPVYAKLNGDSEYAQFQPLEQMLEAGNGGERIDILRFWERISE